MVRQNRQKPDTHEVRLAVLVVRGAATPSSDPVVHLMGGPGVSYGSLRKVIGGAFGKGLAEATGREFIVFDQRGTGRSRPSLDCKGGESLGDCASRLAGEGVDFALFNTEESAADVEDLRVAMGYERLNLYGQSYGTSLALTVMRRFPGSVRSALLESVSSTPFDMLTNSPRAFASVMDRVASECAVDPGCSKAFPDPKADLETLLASSPDSTPDLKVLQTLANLSRGTSYLPLALRSFASGEEATSQALRSLASTWDKQAFSEVIQGFNPTMLETVNCYDFGPLWSQTAYDATNAGLAPALLASFGSDVEQEKALCATLPPSQVSAAQQQPVVSDIPTLLLSGSHDTTTPVELGEKVAATLSVHHRFVIPGWGHVIRGMGNTCVDELYQQFLAEPSKTPAADCQTSAAAIFATSVP